MSRQPKSPLTCLLRCAPPAPRTPAPAACAQRTPPAADKQTGRSFRADLRVEPFALLSLPSCPPRCSPPMPAGCHLKRSAPRKHKHKQPGHRPLHTRHCPQEAGTRHGAVRSAWQQYSSHPPSHPPAVPAPFLLHPAGGAAAAGVGTAVGAPRAPVPSRAAAAALTPFHCVQRSQGSLLVNSGESSVQLLQLHGHFKTTGIIGWSGHVCASL